MARYYVIDYGRLHLREVLRLTRWQAPVWLALRASGAIPRRSEPMRHGVPFMAVPPGEIPVRPRADYEAFVADATAAGCVDPMQQVLYQPDQELIDVALRHASGRFWVRLIHCRGLAATPNLVDVVLCVVSRLGDGRWLVTGNKAKRFDDTEGLIVERLPGCGLPELIAHHEHVLARLEPTCSVVRVRDAGDLRASVEDYETHCYDHGVRRQLYVPVDGPPSLAVAEPEPAAAADAPDSRPGDGAPGEDPYERAVLDAIASRESRKASLTNTVAVALLSLAVFVGIGGLHWSWSFAAMLAGVVVVHELGHYVLMRAFGYRNLKMFFIPLVGAAVTGQAHGVPGWKKALVSLAGPLPGIAAGFVLLALDGPDGMAGRIAVVSFILNGINLLPFLPLDGGWVVDATLTSRVPLLQFAARVIAVTAFAGLGLATGSWFALVMAALLGLGLPVEWRLANVTTRLKAAALPVAAGGSTVPPDAAIAITRALRASAERVPPPSVTAMQVLQVHEHLATRPPGALATVLLLGLHAGAGLAALIGLAAAAILS